MKHSPYKIDFTQAAKVEAVKRGLTLEMLEAYVRADLESNGYHEREDAQCYPPNLFLHTVDYDQPRPWVVVGDGKRSVVVDAATYNAGRVLDRGPFKGKKFCLPVPDSEPLFTDDEEE